MRRTALVLLTAALALTAVSCGKYDPPASQVTEEEEAIESALERGKELSEKLEKAIDVLENPELPVFDSHAGINIKAGPLPENDTIPDDWHEITDGFLAFTVPADVEINITEYDLGNGQIFRSASAGSEDGKISILFVENNNIDWSKVDEPEGLDQDDDEETEKEMENKYRQQSIDKGYPQKGDITDEKTARYMAEMGLEYDGTKESKYKALLEFNEDMLTEDNQEAFEYIAMVKAKAIGMEAPEFYYTENDGHSVFVHPYMGLFYDPSKQYKSDYKKYWVSAYASPDMAYSAIVTAYSGVEALQIASTARIAG